MKRKIEKLLDSLLTIVDKGYKTCGYYYLPDNDYWDFIHQVISIVRDDERERIREGLKNYRRTNAKTEKEIR